MSGREPTFAEFRPTPLAARRRRVDPVVVGVVAVTLAVGAAVAKPWEHPAATGPVVAASVEPGMTGPGAARATDPRPMVPRDTGPDPGIGWPQVAAAVQPHETWGARAIVRDPARAPDRGGRRLVERFAEFEPDPDGVPSALLATADQGVLALGLTFPPDDLPLDVRVWRASGDGWEWLQAAPVGPSPAFGAFLFAPPRIDGATAPTWPTGSYRIQVLTGTGVRDVRVDLPDRFEVVPGPSVGSAERPDAPSPLEPVFRTMGPWRPFVVQDGVATPLLGGPSEPLDLPAAWLDAGPDGAAAPLDRVASIYAPRAAGLGVLLPVGAWEVDGTIRAIAPDARDVDATRWVGQRFDGQGRAPYLVFRAPDAGVWPAGIYRIEAAWTDASGTRRHAAYHTELRPGPGGTVAEPLAAARALARIAGTDVVAGAGGLFIEGSVLACDAPSAAGGAVPSIIGIAHAPGAAPTDLAMDVLLGGGRTAGLPVLVTSEPIPGLTLVAPAAGERFTPGVYRIVGTEGGRSRPRTVCVGGVTLD